MSHSGESPMQNAICVTTEVATYVACPKSHKVGMLLYEEEKEICRSIASLRPVHTKNGI